MDVTYGSAGVESLCALEFRQNGSRFIKSATHSEDATYRNLWLARRTFKF